MVESKLIDEKERDEPIITERPRLQEETRNLRKELELRDAKLRELETEIFKLQQRAFLSSQPEENIYSEKLAQVLRSGGTWPGRELLKELGINHDDTKAIQILTKQLQILQDFGLVRESARGWRWIG